MLVKRNKTGKRPAHWKPTGVPRQVDVTLQVRHTINGVTYGPGEVRVPAPLARELEVSERHMRNLEFRVLNPRDSLISISNGRPVVIPVKQGYLDHAVNDIINDHAAPGVSVSGR